MSDFPKKPPVARPPVQRKVPPIIKAKPPAREKVPPVVKAKPPVQGDGRPFQLKLPDNIASANLRHIGRHKSAKPIPLWLWCLIIGGGGAALLCSVIGVSVMLSPDSEASISGPVRLKPIDDQRIDELCLFDLTVEVEPPVPSDVQVRYTLLDGPKGAHIERSTGRFTWYPNERQGPGEYQVTVAVARVGLDEPDDRQQFSLAVGEVNKPPELARIHNRAVRSGGVLTFTARVRDTDIPNQAFKFSLLPGAPAGAQIDAETGEFFWAPADTEPSSIHRITVCVTEAMPGGLSTQQDFNVRLVGTTLTRPPPPVNTIPKPTVADAKTPPGSAASSFDSPGARHGSKIILDLYKQDKLFLGSEYKTLRKVFSERFEKEHQDTIRRAYGDRYDAVQEWLNAHVDIKEEFYTAIKPDCDNVPQVLSLFKELFVRFPNEIQSYANLAIAVAVTWDNPGCVYDYTGHQRRTKSIMPKDLLDAVGNFQYMVDARMVMQGRARFLPWEFLVYIVNHKTPRLERQWAVANYLPKRTMFGKCYHDVPYDKEMLESKSERTRLKNRYYTLPNIRRFGGVCAMQADFAARVGKSLGVPAEYVVGLGRGLEPHGWVMWVELKQVTSTSIVFSLKSWGRYRGDKYYVGESRDPQTGQRITDRQMELRLNTVGMNPLAKRHAALVMKSYGELRKAVEMDVDEQLSFLGQTVQLCPGNEAAWIVVAGMAKKGVFAIRHTKTMKKTLDQLFRTFAKCPDFTWEIFDDLISFEKGRRQRINYYQRLVVLYEAAGRPDLACKARLKLTDYLIEKKQYGQAVEGLAFTIKKFPDEGRYVPLMLDKLEEICQTPGVEGAGRQLVLFYTQFLPMIPKQRGNEPNVYCITMFRRAIPLFKAAGEEQLARMCEMELSKLTGVR